jgi:dTMP kinase
MKKGLFITFEGIDGCGKTTQLRMAAAWLKKARIPFIITREPGGTSISEQIRNLVMSNKHQEMCTECEVLLYIASRAQHVSQKILPALNKGISVLCDRFDDATFAYQGYGRKVPMAELRLLDRYATKGLKPDLTFIFDLPVIVAHKRMTGMHKTLDRLENSSRLFFERTRRGYLALAAAEPRRCKVLDADKGIKDLASLVLRRIGQKFNVHW